MKCKICGHPPYGDNFICDKCREDVDDIFDDRDELTYDDIEELRQEENAETAANCRCGAWKFGKDGNAYKCADCICGAE